MSTQFFINENVPELFEDFKLMFLKCSKKIPSETEVRVATEWQRFSKFILHASFTESAADFHFRKTDISSCIGFGSFSVKLFVKCWPSDFLLFF